MKATRQLALDLAGAPSFTADQFLQAPCNEAAFAAVTQWASWSDNVMTLVGPTGSGKTHLAMIFAEVSDAVLLNASQIDLAGPIPPAAILDDLDRAERDEATLFHLLNRIRAEGSRLLVTARVPPSLWGLRTPDLLSRLRLAPCRTIEQPDLTLLKAVMVKLFGDRQILTDDGVIGYAVRHCEQSLDGVRRFVEEVDRSSLERGGRVTKQLASASLAKLAAEDQGPT